MNLSHPQAVLERLAEIEKDLGDRQNDYESAAGARARLVRDWEKRIAIARKTRASIGQSILRAQGRAA